MVRRNGVCILREFGKDGNLAFKRQARVENKGLVLVRYRSMDSHARANAQLDSRNISKEDMINRSQTLCIIVTPRAATPTMQV